MTESPEPRPLNDVITTITSPGSALLGGSSSQFDILETLDGARRFVIRHALLVTSLVWFLSGAQISLSLFVTQEPPRFPICQPGDPNCHPNIPLDVKDCTSDFNYMRRGISIVSTYNLPTTYCEPRPWVNVTWIHSALFLGMLVGALTISPVADRKGRRPVMTLGVMGLTLAAIYSTMASSIYLYGIARFVVGCCLSASALPSMAILSEITLSRRRQWIIAVQAVSFCIAAAYVSLLACVIPSWRILTLLVTLPSFFFVCGLPCCGGVYIESPRWLAAKGRMEDAFSTWIRIARIARIDLPDDLDLDLFVKNELQAIHKRRIKSDSDLEEELSMMSVRQMVTPDTLGKAFKMFPASIWLWISMWVWLVCAFVYYGVLLDFGDLIASLRMERWDSAVHQHTVDGPHILQRPPVPSSNASNDSLNVPAATHIRRRLDDDSKIFSTVAAILGDTQQSILHGLSVGRPLGSLASPIAPTRFPDEDEMHKSQPQLAREPPSHPNDAGPPLQEAKNSSLQQVDVGATRNDPSVIDEKKSSRLSPISSILDRERAAAYLQYLSDMGTYVRNGSMSLYESAKSLPQEAERLYDEMAVQKRLDDFYSDVSAQFTPEDPMALYWKKMRLEGFLVLISFSLEIPAYAIGMLLAGLRRVGRKGTTIALLALGGLSISTAYAAQFSGLTGFQLLATTLCLVVLGRCCIAVVFMLLYLYSAELFPTSVRGSVLGLFSGAARIGCIFAAPLATYLNGLQNNLALCFFGILSVLAAIMCISTLPETLGQPLYDTLDTLDDVYTRSQYADTFFNSLGVRICSFLGRGTCCFGWILSRCLGLPNDMEPTSFEAKGHAWLKKQWRKTREGSKGASEKSQFVPITDEITHDPGQLASASTVRTFELGELDDSYDEDSQRPRYSV